MQQPGRVLPPVPPSRLSRGPPPRLPSQPMQPGMGAMVVAPPPGMPPPPPSRQGSVHIVVSSQPMPDAPPIRMTNSFRAGMPVPQQAALPVVPPPPGFEPPAGLAGQPARRTLVLHQDAQLAPYRGDEKWDNQSVSSFDSSTATTKSQGHHCRCDKCKMERRMSHRNSIASKHSAHRRHSHRNPRRKSVATRVAQAVLFPVASCIST